MRVLASTKTERRFHLSEGQTINAGRSWGRRDTMDNTAMKLRHLLPVLLLCLPVFVSAETVDSSNLVKREGLYYKKFTDVPFTGKTSGRTQTTYKDEKEHGPYAWYLENGQLWRKGTYKNGNRDGLWFTYHENGQLD